MYMEDLDLCYRSAQAGWITWYEPSVEASTSRRERAGSTGACVSTTHSTTGCTATTALIWRRSAAGPSTPSSMAGSAPSSSLPRRFRPPHAGGSDSKPPLVARVRPPTARVRRPERPLRHQLVPDTGVHVRGRLRARARESGTGRRSPRRRPPSRRAGERLRRRSVDDGESSIRRSPRESRPIASRIAGFPFAAPRTRSICGLRSARTTGCGTAASGPTSSTRTCTEPGFRRRWSRAGTGSRWS